MGGGDRRSNVAEKVRMMARGKLVPWLAGVIRGKGEEL